MSNIEDAIRRLTPEQRALLERRLKQKRKDSPAQDTSIRPRPDTSDIPLSAGQRRLLALEQLFPNTPQFNITVARRLMGTLDVSLFEASIRHVLERHEVLRGRFSLLNNVWQQQIGEVPDVCLKRLDLSHLPAPKRLQRAIQVVRKDLETPFDLSRGPLMRAGLIKMGPNDFLFSLTIHHIAADAWSVNLLLQEVAEVYSARIIDAPSPLEQLPIQYADFAHWQINWLETDEAAKQLSYWENTFDEAPEQLKLPTNSDPRTVQSVDGAAQTVFLSKELTASLKDVSINHKLTPFTLFLAAFKATLYRYTHQKDMIVCAPIAGRHRVEIEPLVGYFNNLIAIRSSLADDVTYRTLANQIADTSMAASDHQDIPFEVVADLPTLRRTPLTRAFFTFQDALAHSFELEGIDSEPIEGVAPLKFTSRAKVQPASTYQS